MGVNDKDASLFSKIRRYIYILFALIYFSLGLWFIMTETNLFEIPLKQQKILGGVFILYGIYRSYRVYRRYFKHGGERNQPIANHDEDDEQEK